MREKEKELCFHAMCVKAYNHAINDDEITFMFILNTTKANVVYV